MSARHVGYRRSKILKSTVKTDSRRELKIVHYGYPSGLEYGVRSQNSKIDNWFMLSVRISSYGCTQEVWRAREKRESRSRRSQEQL